MIIFSGEYTSNAPFLDGYRLNKIPTDWISSMMIRPGILLNGEVMISALAQYLFMWFLH